MISSRTSPSNGETTMNQPSQDRSASSRLLVLLHHLFAFAPSMALVAVYTCSWRIASLIGYWPRPSLDDPKFAAPGDLLSTLLYFTTMLLLVMSATALFVAPILSFVLRRAYARAWSWMLLTLFALSWIVLRADPGGRLTWFAD